MLATLLAINWEPELRGILTVMIGAAVWMGSVYLILGTNLGARLGFLVSMAGLFGWMALMGAIWWMYGIGLQGDLPSWQPVEGRTVIQEVDLLYEAGVLEEPLERHIPLANPAQRVTGALQQPRQVLTDQIKGV